MRPWKRAVAVPLLITALAGAGIAATWLYQPAPLRAGTAPPWTPPLRHGGCDSQPKGKEPATRLDRTYMTQTTQERTSR